VAMTIENIIDELKLRIFTGYDKVSRPVKGAYSSDLLSDVMGKAKDGGLWITVQTHKNIIAVASLKDLAAVLIVNGGKPDEDTLKVAESEGIVLLGTSEGAFEACGKLYKMMERNAVV
jgi:predicted transcriptional regulator